MIKPGATKVLGITEGLALGVSALGAASLGPSRLGQCPAILMSLLVLTISNFGTAFVSSFHQY